MGSKTGNQVLVPKGYTSTLMSQPTTAVKDWLEVTLKSLSEDCPHLEAFHRGGSIAQLWHEIHTVLLVC